MMKTILCYGDSNTFGHDPEGKVCRLPYEIRWPGGLQKHLGGEYRVIEEAMCGRTTVWEDPLMPGRNGLALLPAALESHRPLDLVILALGTNDCKTLFRATPHVLRMGMERLVETVRHFDYGAGVPVPQILILSPIHMGPQIADSIFGTFDESSAAKAEMLAPLYKELAQTCQCGFLDASRYAGPGPDQLHMTAEGHQALAAAAADAVREMLK